MSLRHRLLITLKFVLFLFPAFAAAQTAYTSVVVIGDSLSDTGNDATVSLNTFGTPQLQVPGPLTGYTLGRFTDGLDTLPAAVNYQGVWIEQLAAMLANKPVIKNSLAGGTNYAYGFATTGTGTTAFTFGPNNIYSFPVNNLGQQLSDYLGTHPTINNKTLFIVWGGANDLINATSSQDIINAAVREVGIVQQLIAAGATEIMVPNLPPLGLVPRFNASATTSTPATQAAAGFDQALAQGLAQVIAAVPTVHIYQLDTYTLFNTIVGPPKLSTLANVTGSSSAAFTGNTSANPDTYLFWDDLHPTTYGHRLLANAALTLLSTPTTTTTTIKSSASNSNLTQSVTFTATVTTTTTTPTGTITFYDGTTAIGSSLVYGSGTTATATFATSTLTAGTHNISAQFAGVNGYANSTATATSQIVTAPALTLAFQPSSITIPVQGSAAVVLTLNPVGGYSGTATVACGTLPAHFTCNIALPSLVLKGDNTQLSTLVTVSSYTPTSSARPGSGLYAAIPGLGLIGLLALRRRKLLNSGIVLALLLSAGVLAGITGCAGGSNANAAPSGTYNVPVTVTVNGTTNSATLAVTVQ